MHDLLTLATREALFLGLAGVIGSGPSRFLPASFDRITRIAFAPILGLAVAVCLFTTIEWYIDGNQAKWLFIPVVIASLGVAIRYKQPSADPSSPSDLSNASRRASSSLTMGIAHMLIVCIAVSFPAAWMMASQHSTGPTAYEVFDSPGYVAAADGAQILSIGKADHAAPPVATFVLEHWINQVQTNNRLDITPVAASLNALVGLHATQTWAADLLAALAIGGLALYGALRMVSRTGTWLGVVAGSLFGATFFLQLLVDGSQAAIVGLAFVVPLLLLIDENATAPSLSTFLITALLLAGLQTVYPIFLLPLLATALVYVAWRLWRQSRSLRSMIWQQAVRTVGYLAGMLVVSEVFDVLAAIRNLPAWASLLGGGGSSASQPRYHLGFAVVGSWLLQVRDFYTTAFGPQSALFDFLPALIIPLCVLVLIVYGLRRTPIAWVPLLFVVICSLGATKQAALDSCSYCEDRSLLPVVPVLLFVAFATLAVVIADATITRRMVASAGLAFYLAFVGLSLNNERGRFVSGGYFLSDSIRDATASVPTTNEPVELEGFGTVPFPTVLAEEALPYEELLESLPSGVSFLDDEPGQGTANALGSAVSLVGNSFDPNYRYVITRVPQIVTKRTIIEEHDGVALERRSTSLDVTLQAGLNAPVNPSGNGGVAGWVNGPLAFVVSGTQQRPAHVNVEFILPSPTFPTPAAKVDRLRRHGTRLTACLPVVTSGSTGSASITSIPTDVGIVLSSMTAAFGRCR